MKCLARFLLLSALAAGASASALAQSVAAALPALESLSLRDAERLLVTRNRELQLARRALQSAEADAITAGAVPNPTLSVSTVGISPAAGIGAGAPWDKRVDTTASLSQLLERGNKRGHRVSVAQGLAGAAEREVANQLRQQRLALAGAYYDLLLAQEKVAIIADTIALFDRTLDAAERRLKAGDIAQADVARIRVDALRTANDGRAAEADRARAQSALAYLIGVDARAAELRSADPWPAPEATALPPVSESMLDARPDVQGAMKRVEAAQSGRELARSLRTRDVTAFVQVERFPPGPAGSASANSVGLGVSVPLFTNYRFEGEIARAEADLDTAQDGLQRVRAQARAELERGRIDLATAAERLQRYEASLLPQARKSADYAEFAYSSGAIGVMDLLDSRRTLRATQVDAVQARADYAKARAVWRASRGDISE